tara:strand:+ start:179 stop:772 length:594 start_codon:yes stop_codon:yes gene_type:complete
MLFRVGDYVVAVRNGNSIRKGEVYRVTKVSSISNGLKVAGSNSMYNPRCFNLYKDKDEMSKFKLGDKVRKISGGTPVYPVGYEGEVTEISDSLLYLDHKRTNSRDEYWELVEDKDKYPNGKHPHHDIILEYAKGAELEFFSDSVNAWRNVISPAFAKNTLYRVKPQQDPAVQAAKKKIEQAEQMLREANDELDRLGL